MPMTEIERRARLRIYEIALDVIREPMDFQQTPPAVDDLDKIIRELEGGFVRLRAAARAAARAQVSSETWLRPSVVVHRYGVPRATLYSFCVANPVGMAGGFAKQDAETSRWLISEVLFERFLEKFYGRLRDADGVIKW